MKAETVSKLRSWAGRHGLTCLDFIREAYQLEGVTLPTDYFGEVLPLMRIVDHDAEPLQPGDIVVIRNHTFATNHCGLMVDETEFIHARENEGVQSARIDCAPWSERIVGYMRLKERVA